LDRKTLLETSLADPPVAVNQKAISQNDHYTYWVAGKHYTAAAIAAARGWQ
jgi:hypothetical protein